MTSVQSIALELEEDRDLDWERDFPEWFREASRDHEFRGNYLYIRWSSRKRDEWPERPEEAAEKIVEDVEGVDRILTLNGNDTSDHGVFKLFRVIDEGLEAVDEIGSSFFHVEADFGGVFGEDSRKPQRYFLEEHGFRLEFYRGPLTDELEEEF